jgi:hypothetical protein
MRSLALSIEPQFRSIDGLRIRYFNGRHDHVVPVVNAEFLDERLTNSRLRIIESITRGSS